LTTPRPNALARPNLLVGAAVGALALAVYLLTLAPTITWRNEGADSGDLVTAAVTFGIPHPPGYPLYTLIAAGFARLPLAEPARGVNLFSAVCAAGAIVWLYAAARALNEPKCAGMFERSNVPSSRGDARLVAASFALTCAFSPLFWSQAVIAEVYALNALFIAALLAVIHWHAASDKASWRVWLGAAIFGLGCAHHLPIALLAPTAFLLLDPARWQRQWVLPALLFFLIPLSLYLYLPLRAAADPPINWGEPRTWENFWWMISAAPYRAYLFNLVPGDLAARIAAAARELFAQFNGWGVALGWWGLAQMWSHDEPRRRRQMLALALAFVLIVAYAIVYASRDSYVYLLPAFMVFALWVAYGLDDLARRLARGLPCARGALLGALLLLPAYNLVAHFSAQDLSRDHQAFDYARTIITRAPREAVILTDGDAHLFALQYYRYVIAPDAPVTVVSSELLQFDWYYNQVRRRMPVLGAPESDYDTRLAQIIEENSNAGRAVYTTTAEGWFASYPTLPEGEIYRIVERRR